MNISAKKTQRSDLFEQIAQMIQWATSCFSTGIGLLELSFVFWFLSLPQVRDHWRWRVGNSTNYSGLAATLTKKTDFEYAELPKNSTNSFKNTVFTVFCVSCAQLFFVYVNFSQITVNDLFEVRKCISSNPKTVSRLLRLPFDCGAVASGLS